MCHHSVGLSFNGSVTYAADAITMMAKCQCHHGDGMPS